MITRRRFSTLLTAGLPLAAAPAPPQPYGALPSARQLRWHAMEFYGFLHFTVNTFTDREWGFGDESPALFHPTQFDPAQIIDALAAAGMKGVILTCKHHDGFCLWPTQTTEHSIKSSPWRDGKGDVVREIADAARRRGLRFGVYLSPWDRNTATYSTPAYLDLYRRQLRELLTNYGEIFEVWFDGANGGDGFYGGAKEKRRIDRKTYYDWPNTWEIVRQLQPGAVMFSDAGPDVRWVGNEKGFAGETSWATFDPVGRDGGAAAPGDIRENELGKGTRNGKLWLPAECDVSIRPGWFWHEAENAKVKTPETLFDLYLRSVGRGANLLLNIPPDRRGLVHEADAASLKAFGNLLRETFARNLALGAKATATNVRGKAKTFAPANLLDGNPDTYWSTDEGVTQAAVTLDLRAAATIRLIRVREHLPLGQRVEGIAIDTWQNGDWQEIAKATSVGACRLIRLAQPVTTTKIRLRVAASPVPPALSEFALY